MGSESAVAYSRTRFLLRTSTACSGDSGGRCRKGTECLVSSDWLELAWVSSLGTERAVFQILHGDFDYYYDLALKHQDVVDVFITCSRLIHEKLVKLLPDRAADIHHIPYGVPIAEKTRAARSRAP